nr:copia protein [Tanacetum cinerariifolium]
MNVKSGSYRSHPEHVALYEALEASMERANRDEFIAEKDKSRKRRCDDQDPPQSPPTDSDQSKNSRHDSNAYGSEHPTAQTFSAWKMFDTRDAPSRQIGKKKISKADLEGDAFKIVKAFHDNNISLEFQMKEYHRLLTNQFDLVNPEGHRVVPDVSKPLPLRGPPGQLMGLHTGGLGERNFTSPDIVPPLIVMQADYKEYKISEADFKNIHPNDFEDLYMLHLQGKLNHLPGSDKVHLYNAVNLWIRNIVIKQHYTIVPKPRAIIYKDRNDQKMMMRENEVHKFSEGTLTSVLEKLDHMVKDFRLFKYNPGMDNKIWSEDDKRRSKEFMEVIEKTIVEFVVDEELSQAYELIGNLKVYEVVLEKDSEISKSKKEKYKSLALKARKVLSKEKASSSDTEDEEYFMAIKENKKEKEDRRCFKCGDPNYFISDCSKHSYNDQKAFIVGCWRDSEDDSKKEEICLMALDNNEDYLTKFDPKSIEGIFLGYSPNSKTCVILNKETIRVEESLNVRFDESLPPKSLPLVDDDILESEIIENQEKDLQIKENEQLNKEIVNIKETKDHPIDLVIEVYVAQPPGFVDFEKPNHVFKLKKALYGLKQAPKAWYDRFKAFLLDHMYTMGLVDYTLFTKKKNSHIIIVQIYLDGIIFGSTCQDLCDDFSKIMYDEFEMSMMGGLNFFLGLQIKQLEDGIFFNQSKYIKKMLKKFGLEDSKPIKTPMSSETKLTRDEDGESVDDTRYLGIIGSLLYLMASRLDIMFSVSLCARFQEAPKTSHLEAGKRIFRYIKGTTQLGLWYPKGTGVETIVYTDSDHAGDYNETALAISTTEAEYVSTRKACQQALWMKQALVDYNIVLDDTPVLCDNKCAIDLSKNSVLHSRTKHIEIRHHFLRENVQKGNISIEKVSSEDNIADILTKPLK